MTARTPPKVPRPERAPLAISPLIDGLHRALARQDGLALTAFWDGPGMRSPLIEAAPGNPRERIVTFLWRDAAAEEVLLFVNRLTDERNLEDSLMRRLPGSDLWHLSYRMVSDWRASYCCLPRARGERPPWRDEADQIAIRAALDHGLPDPRNPERSRGRAGAVHSVVALPDAPAQPWLAGRGADVPRRAVEEMTGPEGRTVWVHRPATTASAGSLPIVVVLDGDVWTTSQDLATTVDNLRDDGLIPPALFLFLDSGGRARRWHELGGGDGVSYIVDRLLPWAQGRLNGTTEPHGVVVAGQSLGALTALRCGILRPDRVGAVLSQSASLWQDDLSGAIAGADLARLRVHLEVGRQEWVLREPNRQLARRLDDAGADVGFVEYNGGHDYACWRGGIADGLVTLLA